MGVHEATDAEVIAFLITQTAMESPLMVEVGVDKALTSSFLLGTFPSLTLVGVDPYLDVYAGIPSVQRADLMGASRWHAVALQRFQMHGHRAKLLRLSSLDASTNWPGIPIDLVFI